MLTIHSLLASDCPDQEDVSSLRMQCTCDVGECSVRIAEEHRSRATDGDIERCLVEGMNLHVALLEDDIARVLTFSCMARGLDHARRQVDTEGEAVGSQASSRARRCTVAAPDVEDLVAGLNARGIEEALIVGSDALIEQVGIGYPVVPVLAIPRLQLSCVRWIDGNQIGSGHNASSDLHPRFTIDHSHLGSLWRKAVEQAVVQLRHSEVGFVDRYGEARPHTSQIIHGFRHLEPRRCRRQGEYLDGVDVR